MNNGRDCPHGRKAGKSDTCDLIEAEKEIEALKAQVERLLKAFDEFHGIAASCDGWEAFPQKALDDACDAMMATPAQCLAEIKAQAGREGFIECYFALRKVQHGDAFDLVIAADEYANQLRQQGEQK